MEVIEETEQIVRGILDNQLVDKVCGMASVPWRNKNEWLDVYKKVYSQKLCDQKIAYSIMLEWQERKKSCPLGVLCTTIMLQGVTRDKVFHSDVEKCLTDENLQIIYGGSIMRFLNFLGSKEVERICGEEKKGMESLYVKARKIGLPDWIVKVRHEVSHGTNLPELGLLRMCIVHILQFLKTSYWEIEERKLHDIVLLRPRSETLKEYFSKLLNIYILVKESQKQGLVSFKAVKDPLVRKEIHNIESYRLLSERLDNAPWEINFQENKRKKPLTEDQLKKYSLSKICKVIVLYIDEYKKINDINIWKMIISLIIEDSIKHKCVRLDIWGSLIKALSDRGGICRILDPLLDNVFKDTEDYNATFWSRKWLILILQALLKRSKVEKLKLALSGQIKKGRWVRRIISSLTSLENDHLKKLIGTARNDVSKKLNMEIYSALSHILEKHDRRSRSMLRFTCEPLNTETIQEYIYKVCCEPNDFTFIAYDFFTDMLENPSRKIRKSMKQLINIYLGNETLSDGTDDPPDVIYTLPMVLSKLGIPEEECLNSEEDFNDDQRTSDKTMRSAEDVPDAPCTSTIDAVFESNLSAGKSSWPEFLQVPWNNSLEICSKLPTTH